MTFLAKITWPEIETLRTRITENSPATVEECARHLTNAFVSEFPAVVLARVFMVLPFDMLSERDHAFARAFVQNDARLQPKTPVLCLMGTAGREAAWNDRRQSKGHLAIPLLDRAFVQGAPMIAKLLADLEVDLAALDDGRPIATRRMLGGRNNSFYVPDAPNAVDDQARKIIPGQAFVTKYGVKTVFGMGGAYEDGTLALAIFFTSEALDKIMVDRFPSFISNFKMKTAKLLTAKKIYAGD